MAVIYMPKDSRFENIGRNIQGGLLQGMQLGMQMSQMKQKKAAGALATFIELGGELTGDQISGIEEDMGWEPGVLMNMTEKMQQPKKGVGKPTKVTATEYDRRFGAPSEALEPSGKMRIPGRMEREAEGMRTAALIKEEMAKASFPRRLEEAKQTKEVGLDVAEKYKIAAAKRVEDAARKLQLLRDKAATERTKITVGKGPTTYQLMTHDRQVRKDAIALVKPMVQDKGKLIEFDPDSSEFKDAVSILDENNIGYTVKSVGMALSPWRWDNVNIILKAGAATKAVLREPAGKKVDLTNERALAKQAIAAGTNEAKVKAAFKQRTGEDY